MKTTHVTSLLVERLEHIPADSVWAHRASGVRGSLIKMIDSIETSSTIDLRKLEEFSLLGFYILEQAAKEKH
ncbi:MAG: hypothetical protein QM730_23060 [Anaerolineales bacterium]